MEIFYKMNKKESILDWFVTYGFAILAVLVAIGVLWLFGVFNPNNFQQDNPYKDYNPNKELCSQSEGIYQKGNLSVKEECCVKDTINSITCYNFRQLNNKTYLERK